MFVGFISVGRAGGLNVARSFISNMLDKNLSATGISVTDTFHYVGRVIGPLYAGLLIDFVAFSVLFASVGVLSILSILVLFTLLRSGK